MSHSDNREKRARQELKRLKREAKLKERRERKAASANLLKDVAQVTNKT